MGKDCLQMAATSPKKKCRQKQEFPSMASRAGQVRARSPEGTCAGELDDDLACDQAPPGGPACLAMVSVHFHNPSWKQGAKEGRLSL